MAGDPLATDAVAAVDASGMLHDVLDLPEHLRDALWRVESAEMAEWDSPGGLLVAGMGASGLGGDLARACLGDHASRPILTARGYGLPGWTTPDTTVLCTSYSGDSEETLAAYEAAGALGATRVVCTTGGRLAELARADGVPVIPVPGGLQSRGAIGYATVAALEVAALCGAAPRMASDIDVGAAQLEGLVAEWHPDGPPDSQAKALAVALYDAVAVVAGAGVTAPVALRWKAQLNTNAKVPAFAAEIPELCHNEIAGWDGAQARGGFAAVFLEDSDTHPRVSERIEVSQQVIADSGAPVHRVPTRGQGAIERVMSLVLLADLVSLYVATLRGVDPTPVPAIDRVKAEVARR